MNYFLNNKEWKGSPEELERFWSELTTNTWTDSLLNNMFLRNGWDIIRSLSSDHIASFESLRYLSVKELAYVPFIGSPNLSWTKPIYENKFLNPTRVLFSSL